MSSMQKTLSFRSAIQKFASRDSDAWTFSGYASKFNGVDAHGDTIAPGAFSKVLSDIEAGRADMPKMLLNHNKYELPVGKWLSFSQTDEGLLGEGELTKGNPNSQAIHAGMRHGTVDGLSVSMGLNQGDYEEQKAGRLLIKNVAKLLEVSVVTFPADGQAKIDLATVKSALDSFGRLAEIEDYLRDARGFSRAEAKATVSAIKRIASQSESDEATALPDSVRDLIIANTINLALN